MYVDHTAEQEAARSTARDAGVRAGLCRAIALIEAQPTAAGLGLAAAAIRGELEHRNADQLPLPDATAVATAEVAAASRAGQVPVAVRRDSGRLGEALLMPTADANRIVRESRTWAFVEDAHHLMHLMVRDWSDQTTARLCLHPPTAGRCR